MDNRTTDTISGLRDRSSFLMPPADISDIERINEDLLLYFYCKIPDDYARLLKKADGIQGPGFTLYGTKSQSLAGGHPLNDLFWATVEAEKKEIISEGVMLGYAQGNTVIVYSKDFEEYRVLDSVTSDVLYRYKYIEDFIIERIDIYDSITNRYKQ